jgi:hypothetical protein
MATEAVHRTMHKTRSWREVDLHRRTSVRRQGSSSMADTPPTAETREMSCREE